MKEEFEASSPLPNLPYELLAKILHLLTVQRRAAVFSLCRRLYHSESLKAEFMFRERPLRFEFIAASGNSQQLKNHVSQTVVRIASCGSCPNKDDRLRKLTAYISSTLYAVAARHGQLDFIYTLRSTMPHIDLSPFTIDMAAEGGHLEIIKAIITNDASLNLTESTWRNFTDGSALRNAASSGHLNVVSYLLENSLVLSRDSTQQVVRNAVDAAAASGHLHVIEYLVSFWNRELVNKDDTDKMPCSHMALNAASKNGHFPVVQYLHKTLNAPATKDALDHAAGHGHLEIVEFLHKYRTEGCTAKAMDFACLRNHLPVVKFLHENRKEGCTAEALNYAASRGNIKVCQFLIKCRREGRISDAISLSRKAGHLALVGYLSDLEKKRDTQGGKGRRR